MSSDNFFVKDSLQDNHLVFHSVMNHVGEMVFQNRGLKREGYNEYSENF